MTTSDIREPGTGEADTTAEEKAGRNAVRSRAKGMSHHEVASALDDCRDRLPEESDDDEVTSPDPAHARARAEFEEWERIEALLATHAGTYDPDTDAFVQGGLAGEADRRAAELAAAADSDAAGDTLLRALSRAGVLGGPRGSGPSAGDDAAIATRLAQADPEAALAVSRWLDTASGHLPPS
ncbi:hypothetical protein [Streptomyces liangshanensis]|uniref:Uncharacterized protein n=1 Tax=Streptomyces liangshanensis TaxID=2717324 RepID=A0A6G9H5U6_9ACTN|nr:hypothetical protein [Streptomyces liangshanensis]QIQ05903.1 hypothetical protein HA039_29595 [Streptomyces liangshanensis]